MLKIKLNKSLIGRPEKHRKILQSLGLTKINREKEFKDNPATRGIIKKVQHLVSVQKDEDAKK